MVLKLLKAIWFLSMLVTLGALLFVYASLPQEVLVQDDTEARVAISNELFFYLAMLLIAVSNALVFVMAKVFKTNEELRAWFFGLIITLNIFFIIGMNFISLYNSEEKYDYDRIAVIIYGSLALIILWAAAWPVYVIFKRSSLKSLI
ncbi:MAG TPA: hypothetical protein VFG46_11695 [Chryseolinea sp.]|nr:hypothetical protein [Chryseolinea sp.]